MAAEAPDGVASPPPGRPSLIGGRRALAAAGAVLLVVGGHLVGSHRDATRVVTGPAQVGARVVTMTGPDGTAYGFRGDMPWIGADDSWHDGGWPECLGSVRALASATFGVTRVDYPNSVSVDQVVYVDCRRRS